MENKSIDIRSISKRFLSIEATVEGPLTAKNDKLYYKAQFMENTADDGGYLSQSRAYTKNFFEDSHSLIFKACEKAVETGDPVKIRAARIFIPTERDFYIVDTEGNKLKRKDGSFRKASGITLFLVADENPLTLYNAQVNAITDRDGWVKEDKAEEEHDIEENLPPAKNTKPNGQKK